VTVSSARVDPALNGYLKKSGEGKQEGCAKAQDGWPALYFLAEGPQNGDQHCQFGPYGSSAVILTYLATLFSVSSLLINSLTLTKLIHSQMCPLLDDPTLNENEDMKTPFSNI
jgi:hypothetical protein